MDTNTLEYFESTKKKKVLPKNILSIGVITLLVISMIGGVFVMTQTGKRKEIRMKVMQSYEFPTPETSSQAETNPSPTINPTATWKTYRTKSYTIQYPERFTVTEQKTPFSTTYPTIYSSAAFTDVQSTITITVARNTANFTLDTLLGQGPGIRYTKELAPQEKVTRKTIAGKEVLFVTDIPSGGNGTGADVLFLNSNKVYQITISPRATDLTTFNLMLGTLVLLDEELPDVTESWLLYADSIYGFSFKYPTTYIVESLKTATSTPTYIMAYDNTKTQVDTSKWKIEVQDPKNFGQSAVTSRDLLKLSLEEYVNKKWEYNKAATDSAYPKRTVGPIQTITLNGKAAYQFTVTDKYVDDHVSEKLNEEVVFIFTENAGYKYKIWYPKSNGSYRQVTDTLVFFK